jgi:hypothetical protein
MSPAKAIVTGCGDAVAEVVDVDVVADVGGTVATTGESFDRTEQQVRRNAAVRMPLTLRPLTGVTVSVRSREPC